MCGIVGYIGKQRASAILLEGLKRLEYRGYDSAGVALLDDSGIEVMKKTGRVENVATIVNRRNSTAQIGISHTRWATHGGVTDANAHPHLSWDGRISIVHNGVIENHDALRRFLKGEGIEFVSQTDTEVLANLIAYHYARESLEGEGATRLIAAVRHSLRLIEGTYGIAVICTELPKDIVGARKGSPLCLGIGNGENLLASDVAAFVGRTQNVVYLDDGQICHLTADDFSITTVNEAEESVDPVISQIDWKIEQAELGAFTHYMEKEIFEQPMALENAMRGRFSDDESTSKFGGLNLDAREFRHVDRIVFLACGTAWHACLVAEYLIEKYARIPVEVEYASEFRYRNAPLDKNTLVFVISQSGETLDTLEALREAKRKGYRVLGITNGVGSTIARETDGGVYQHAGPEIGVASTKAFTSQVLIGGMLALHLGRMRDLSFSDGREMVKAFRSLPGLVSQVLGQAEQIKEIASRYTDYEDFLFLGRQSMFPIALEGALKLKEISYIHAEGYPAAEMKHGPIALISEKCPSVVLSPHGDTFSKVLSNIQETRARKGRVIAITSAGKDFPEEGADDVIHIPHAHDCVMPILATIPLQLLAYYIAVNRECDVDKPRNLAKSVTVE
ncbi:glutamine--fructose-6-phosphate transaminase (isomerizing) [Cerasicoccus arenae]|uniref:Glutamine--fructose-6-phosphate aminotransferase [isomerizing] n=1 Tax=Cerasicoccus arenae TaxID=424488 RepID=A0A8J3DCN0_9BACT|nr:glutamine--fructose-6-phosphate transaminase (isomerizing) [Cerasicoccus arenae]MBK1858626.1 glutamine--fructose-6-phosphate transaminase (isomerizing) [Cerasicoccus arenae]GHC04915.1 glutamine--fructose-6-phosphate aminotransferase [isomerizing] [Cerasicoccus arenae]